MYLLGTLAGGLAVGYTAQAGTATFDFSTDPATDSRIKSVTSNNPDVYQSTGGNPGGFLSITESVNSLSTVVVFNDIDNGNVVKSFKLTADLRVGNSVGDRGADGFSISYARSGDPLIDTGSGFAAGLPEAGSTTGIAIGFDTWSGNTLPDGADIEGIIVRVDDKTVLRSPLATRHGACTDATSIQTGPWSNDGGIDTSKLCWAPLSVELDEAAKLTVSWKGKVLLDKFQTTFFPSPGQLVLAGRTGGANEKTHIDNIKITTTAAVDKTPPSNPGTAKVDSAGSRSVKLSWGAATDDSGLVAYNVLRDGVVVGSRINALTFTDGTAQPNKTYKYKVQAQDVANNTSAGFSNEVTATTIADADSPGFIFAEIYDNIAGASPVSNLFDDPKWATRAYDRAVVLPGISFGEPAFGNTYGENIAVVLSGTITAPETASYDFFVRSDDASQLFLNLTGTSIPDPLTSTVIAEETGCCNSFQEPGATQTTAAPISLTAGKQYGFIYIVKEGGGGDWGQVAMRKVGDTTPAANLPAIRGIVTGKVDPNGANVAITTQPASVTTAENSSVSFTVAATGDSPQSPGNIIYQWYKNGNPILGANAATYTIALPKIADNGAKFKVAVDVAGKSVTSTEATLTVTADNVAPTITKVAGSDDFTHATVWFSEPVTAATAEVAGNYTIAGLTVSAAKLQGLSTVVLTTSKQAEGTDYTLAVAGVKDTATPANTVAAGTTKAFKSFVFLAGVAKDEFYKGITGVSIADLEAAQKYIDHAPDEVRVVAGLEGPTSYADNYGGKIVALLTPQKSGNYVFYMSTDDNGSLRLSTDENPANKVEIATEPVWNGVRDWTGTARRNADAPENKSAPIALVAGKRYYIELLNHEGGGGDNSAATFTLDGTTPPSTPIQGADLGWFVDPKNGPPTFTKQPSVANSIIARGASVTLSVDTIGADPMTFQWSVNGYNIAGATGKSLTIPSFGLANIGHYAAVATNGDGTTKSQNIYLGLSPDDALPAGAFIIESEEFNYDGGKHKTEADAAGYKGGAYDGLSAVLDTDYHDGGSNQNVAYRSADQTSAMTGNSDNDRGTFDVTTGYKMGWNDAGDWWNYTRNLGAGKSYNIVARFSSGGSDVVIDIGTVTGAATTTQTVSSIGTIKGTASGGWDTFEFIPLRDASGNLISVPLGGETTFRLAVGANSNQDMNYFALVPASGGSTGPTLSIARDGANVKITYTGTLQGADSVTGPWTDTAGASSPFTATPSAAQKFWRAKQ